jgi:dolichyl-phosphate beta-glucosyltransferase
MIHLSVVIPAYNEAERIGPTLEKIMAYLQRQPFQSELIVVSDGSTDGTENVAWQVLGNYEGTALIGNGVNRGKGFSVHRGMLEARGNFILFCDADLSTPIEDVERLLAALEEGADIAIGSRGLAASDIRVRQPYWREAMGRIFNWFVQRVAVPGIQDTQCGFKCFPRHVARTVFPRQRLDGFGFDVEILFVSRLLGYRIAEVPVTWRNHPLSKVHPIRDSASMLLDLLRIRSNHRRQLYGVARVPQGTETLTSNAGLTGAASRDHDAEDG